MKQILFFILVVGICENSFSQNQRFIQPNTNLYTIRQQVQPYYDSLLATGDTALLGEGTDYAEYIKYMNFWEPRLFPHGDFTRYFDAQKTFYSSNPSFANSDPWWEIGPTKKTGIVGIGPIEEINFSKTDPNRMLCCSTAGGIFYSTDGGNNWQHTGTDTWATTSGVESAVFDINDFHTWYAASSGQGRAVAWPIGETGGIFRTTNEGQTWSRIAGKTDLGSTGTRINKILIDPAPQNPGDVIIYAVTSDGVSKTYNADAASPAWTKLNIPSSANGNLPSSITSHPTFGTYYYFPNVYDIEFNPSNSQTLYATIRFFGFGPSPSTVAFWRLMQSNNGGSTWFEVANQPTFPFYQPDLNTPYFENADNETIEVTNAMGASDYLYFTLDNGTSTSSNPNGELWRLTVSTNNWTQIANNIYVYMGGGNGFGVSQFNPDEIYISHYIDFKKINFTGILNGGQTYISNGQYHMDVEDLVGDPVNPNVVWMANHGGVYKSTNNGVNWQDKSDGIGNAWVFRMAATSFADPSYVAMGLDHNWSVISSSAYTNNWTPTIWNTTYTGDGQRPLIDDTDPHNVFFSASLGNWLYSNNFGSSFSGMPACSPFWIGEGVLNKKTSTTIYRIIDLNNAYCGIGPSGHRIYRSFDRGQNNVTIADFSQAPFNYNSANGYTNYIIWKLYTPQANGNYLLANIISDHGKWQPCTNCPTVTYEKSHLWRTKNG